MQNIFIIGSKGIPANYGGFETFVDKLVEYKKRKNIHYHVSCLSYSNNEEFYYNNARCFNVKVGDYGSGKAIIYDILALRKSYKYIKENNISNAIIYILACRIGPFLYFYKKKLEKDGIKVYINPDGHEWKRSKWNKFIRMYWKISEKLMVKEADLLICDSIGIEEYIKETYFKYSPKTTYIAYGADMEKSSLKDDDEKFLKWCNEFSIIKNEYYLIVGRFVPENNYELIIREFMNSNSKKELVIITNKEENQYYKDLMKRTRFTEDNRVKFVGTVYDYDLLKKIREEAFGYFHGHEVGGTNPSLLEALASTKLNILLNVNFNKEVGREGAVYFTKENNNLSETIYRVENFEKHIIDELSVKAKKRIAESYSWNKIVNEYEELFLTNRSVQ
jgi:rhamnosyltransferase